MIESLPIQVNDEWILGRRSRKIAVDPLRPYSWLLEEERTQQGQLEKTATIFLTNRECPFRCVFCDLWKNTTDASVAVGAIPAQICWALDHLPPASHVKLYNSGNFFDSKAIPVADIPQIATLVRGFKSVIVESHPKLIGDRCLEFKEQLHAELQVAMGLETVHPTVLANLNKSMTLEDFERATGFLLQHAISVRAFILLRPPFMDEADGIIWAKRSIEFAFEVGVECCIVIPTRGGNGALDWLRDKGFFSPPKIQSLEKVIEYGIQLQCGRVFADVWDIEKFSTCKQCGNLRIDRLHGMNRDQEVLPPIHCDACS